MAEDADGNYYYDAGTVNEQMDNVDVYEDADGNFGVLVNGQEMRVHELGHLFGGKRGPPSEADVADGEVMLYVSDGTTNADGDLVIAEGTTADTGDVPTAIVTSPTY